VWFNRKYQRAGHLFQDRYRSECVETDEYYKTVLRYILQNPMKAGLESSPGNYKWSSYAAYIKGQGILTDTEYATDLFGGREALIDYLAQDNDDHVMDEGDHDWRLRDDEARTIINRITNCASVSDFQRLDASVQKEYAWALYQEKLSLGQIARLTGLSKATVFRTVRRQRDMSFEEETDLILRESDLEDGYDADLAW
jgi:predicted DNA-binding protein YlxM (UPF0122 family)